MNAGRPPLNAGQRRAVEAADGPLLVLAGPGTGKTGVLAARVLYLIGTREIAPERVLALTFSRRAAGELERRLREVSPLAAGVEVRTFHSFALRLVRKHYASLGLSEPPGIVPTARRWELLRNLLDREDPADWNLAPDAFAREATVKEVYDLLLRARECSRGPAELRALGERHGLGYLKRAAHVLAGYDRLLEAASEVDYEGVVQQALGLLREGREPVAGRYEHVLVDEFQDTNRSQLDLLKALTCGERANVFCVGDDAQSIYGFRGARAENVGEFERHFPGARVLELGTNYRSAQPVVTLAGAALAVEPIARERAPQSLPGVKEGSVVRQVRPTEREEGEWISDRILELYASGVPFEEVAVLRRSLLDAGPLVEALRSRGIPVDLANVPARTSAGRLAVLFLAAAGEDPSPKQASRALISPLAGLSPEAARSLRAVAETSSLSVFELIRAGLFPAGLSEGDRNLATRTVEAVDAARRKGGFLEKLDLLWKRLPGTRRLFEAHARDAGAARALADASAFVRAAKAHARAALLSGVEPDAARFIAAGDALDGDSDTWAPPPAPVEGAVRMMTVHASKGLEFEAVFISGLTEGRFPLGSRGVRFVDAGLLAGRGPTSARELEAAHRREERRLFYVALTRAKSRLYLTGVQETSPDGAEVSSFLKELEPHLATLEAARPARRFWTSRGEAVEELRRLACDASGATALPERFAASRALAELDERPAGAERPWWRYVRQTAGEGAAPPAAELREGQVAELLGCPRRAFLSDLAGGARRRPGGSGRAAFGAVFARALEAFLGGREGSLREVLREEVGAAEFGGPAFREHWLREVDALDAACDGWARELRESLVLGGGEWTVEVAGRRVSGRHGPVAHFEGRRVLVQISSSKRPLGKEEAKTDARTALRALGAGAEGAEIHYPRKLAYGRPTVRVQSGAKDDSGGWREVLFERLRLLFEGLESGEYPPDPENGPCERCAFRATCAPHRGDEVWLVSGGEGRSS